jgi:hypothetical protein
MSPKVTAFQMLADGLQGPPLSHLAVAGLERVPEVVDEVKKAAAAGLLPSKLFEVALELLVDADIDAQALL